MIRRSVSSLKRNKISHQVLFFFSNIYSSLDQYEQAKYFRSSEIKRLSVTIEAGVSWTEINGQIMITISKYLSYRELSKRFPNIFRYSKLAIVLIPEIDAKIDRLKSKAMRRRIYIRFVSDHARIE